MIRWLKIRWHYYWFWRYARSREYTKAWSHHSALAELHFKPYR